MKVLLIEDNPGDAHLVRKALSGSRSVDTVVWAERLGEGLGKLDCQDFDVILADLYLPDASGLQVVAALSVRARHIPLIVLTSLADDSTADKALDTGAQDYLMKGSINASVLERSIRYALHRHEIITANAALLRDVSDAKQLLERKNHRLTKLCKTAQQFVDHVSHEFRTPLSVIKEYASLIADEVVGSVCDEQKRMLQVIDDRTNDLNTMVDDMLDVSKLKAGLLGAWRRPCSVQSIIEPLLPVLERKAATRGVQFAYEIEPSLPLVYCDEEKAGRVLINLTVNAIKFTGKSGRVQVSARLDAGHRQVAIDVTDNGPGMSPRELRRIFKKFSQLTSGLQSNIKGYGLGLGIAQQLAQLNFGGVSVTSEPGHGSTFSYTIPLAMPHEVVSRYLKRMTTGRRRQPVITILLASIGPQAGDGLADDVDRFLNHLLRRNDLLFRVETRSWLAVLPTAPVELDRFVERAETEREHANRNRPQAPLPPIAFQLDGSWPAAAGKTSILQAVARRFSDVAGEADALSQELCAI